MDKISQGILKELLPAEKEVAPLPSASKVRKEGAVDHWTSAVLLERAAYLRKLAQHGDGTASETLKEYSGHYATLCFRNRDGVAESHGSFADIFIILDGCATLVTGGKLVNAKSVAPGEMRGDAIEGGTRKELRAGDVVHIPAGVPHQMLAIGEKTISNIVVKIQQDQ
ncbi:MAG: cupin domain-containing protein [Terracidiphilus sp.]|nr:cupin domain-containing protein [Terracidiphilus sp.]MDR3777229.1 cupin domain-containing protein [Terracidiphilus sp.]